MIQPRKEKTHLLKRELPLPPQKNAVKANITHVVVSCVLCSVTSGCALYTQVKYRFLFRGDFFSDEKSRLLEEQFFSDSKIYCNTNLSQAVLKKGANLWYYCCRVVSSLSFSRIQGL